MKKHFETFAIAIFCTMFVLSMNRACSGLTKSFNKENKKIEINKKTQELKKNAIRIINLEQKVR